MIKRSTLWRLATGAYVFINVAGLFYAWAMDEEMHAMTHLFLLILGLAVYVGWRLARRRAPQDHLPRAELAEQRIEYLQQSIDAMALELERVGEAQRFSDKLRVERGETPPLKKDQ
jgi:type VI protein secretion system component VasK